VLDAPVVAASLLLAWSARAITADLDIRSLLLFGLATIGVCITVNYLLRLYHRLWRYASAGETRRGGDGERGRSHPLTLSPPHPLTPSPPHPGTSAPPLVLGDRHAIPQIVARHGVDLIVLAMYNISGEDFRAILDICLETPAAVKVLPNIFDFIRGTNGSPPVRDITAEDLLGRKPVEIDLGQCRNSLYLPCEL